MKKKSSVTQFRMGSEVKAFVKAHRILCKHHEESGLTFTLDGKLVGDLAEVIAADLFGLILCRDRTAGVDCHTKSGRSVQVKATGLPNKGPAFTPGEGRADHLIFLRLDFDSATGEVAYNGPEELVRRLLKVGFTGTKRVPLRSVRKLDAAVPSRKRLSRVR